MKYTPGPWTFVGNRLIQTKEDGSIPIDSRMVVVLGEISFDGKKSNIGSQNDLALIATAPQMLEALKVCSGIFWNLALVQNEESDFGAENFKECFKEVQLIIKKAEGEE